MTVRQTREFTIFSSLTMFWSGLAVQDWKRTSLRESVYHLYTTSRRYFGGVCRTAIPCSSHLRERAPTSHSYPKGKSLTLCQDRHYISQPTKEYVVRPVLLTHTNTLPFFSRLKNKNKFLNEVHVSVTSVHSLAPLNLRCGASRRVSCYALFKGWLLLSQPPRCIRHSTTFHT